MVKVRVTQEHFNIGTTHYPVGSEIEVNETVKNYLLREGSAELVDGYTRRDMQAESKPKRRRGRPRKTA